MKDLITHVPSIIAMGAEGRAIAQDKYHPLRGLFTVDEGGSLTFNVTKIPVEYVSGDSSLCLCRGVTREELALTTTIKVLGECINKEYIFDSDADKNTYESLYNTLPVEIDDGKGGTVTYTPPYMIGIFAG